MNFQNYNPISVFIYFAIVMVISMFTNNPVLQMISLIGGISFLSVTENFKSFISNITFYIPLFILVAITNPLFSHNGATPLFFMNGNPVTYEAIIYGIFISVMIVSVMYWFKCFSTIFTTDKIIYLTGRISPRFSVVLSMTIRFIPLFKSQSKKVGKAQKAMGLYTSKSCIDKIRSAVRVFSSMVTWGLENGIETADSMKARGYGLKGRTSISPFKFGIGDILLIFICMLLGGITIYGMLCKELDFYFYPKITAVPQSVTAYFSYISFGILCMIPFITEIKEMIKWKYFLSKI